MNFFIFTFFNRKFRRELARICFHTRTRTTFLRTTSHQFLKRTSSNLRSPQLNHFNVIIFSSSIILHPSFQIVHPDYCEYQKRLQKKSPQSSYHLDVICTRSTSFNGTHPLKFSRYSMHDFRQTPTHSPYSQGKRPHERYLSPVKKTSLPSRTSTSSTYIRETPVQYVNYKLDHRHPLSNKTRT